MAQTSKNDILRYLKSLLNDDEVPQQEATDFFPYIIYVLEGEEKRIRVVNKARVKDYLGYTSEEIETWNSNFFQMIFKDDLDMVMSEIEKYDALEDDHDHAYQCRLNHREGDWRYFRTRGSVLKRDDGGKPKSWIFVAEDITDKTKTQEDIHALQTLVDDTEELLLYGSWSWDLKIDKMYWTNGIYHLLGYEKEDVEPTISSEFYFKHIHPEDLYLVKSVIQRAIDNNSDFDVKYHIITHRGEEKIVSTKGKTIRDKHEEVVKAIGITRDITKQTLINRDLVNYKEMIYEKEEFLNQGSWETRLPQNITTWSPGMFRLFGYEPVRDMPNLEVTHELQYEHMTGEDAAAHKKLWENILAEKDSFISECTIRDKQGVVKKLETYGKVIRDYDRTAVKVIGTTRNVTQLREYEKGLEDKINELNQHNTELEDFAYVASHDLQEPLRKLTTFSERLRTKFSTQLGNEGTLYLERISAATENMRVLIENLLEFSRTARSDKHFFKKNIGSLLDEVLNGLELKIEETGTQINYEDFPEMEVIPTQIKQLFDNLLNNSIKFKKQDTPCVIDINCSRLTAGEKSEFSLHDHNEYYKINIVDNGIGFEKEYSERIFQIFQRLHGKSEYPGSGIGLAICKKIVENHHGLIFAEGSPGSGASFSVILPVSQS